MNNSKKIIKIATTLIVLIAIFITSSFASNTTENTTTTQTKETTKNQTSSEETKKEDNKTENTTETKKIQVTNTSNNSSSSKSTSKSQNTSSNNNTKTTTQTTSTTKQTVKSSNANLANLGITPHDFSGFRESKTEYTVNVPNDVSKVQVYATKKDSKATIKGTGNINLQEGSNSAKVVVTAEDGTQKTYTINIIRLKEGEEETEETTDSKETSNSSSNFGLDKLEIKGLNLEPEFNKDTYLYTVALKGEDKKLDIEAEASNKDAIVQIVGNSNIIDGKNVITILVTSKDGKNVVTYQVNVNKNMASDSENKNDDKAQNMMWIIIIGIVLVVVIALIIILKRKKRINEYYEEEEENIQERINELKERNSKNKKTGRHSK